MRTITVEDDVFERVQRLQDTTGESVSDLLRRTLPSAEPLPFGGLVTIKASELLEVAERPGGLGLSEEGIRAIEEVREAQRKIDLGRDPWSS